MKALFLLMLSGLASASLLAQGTAENSEDVQRATVERALDQNREQVARLLDMRMRHDLGLLPELDEDIVRVTAPITTREMARQRMELTKLTDSTDYLRREYEKRRQALSRMQEDAQADQAGSDAGQFVSVPSQGRAPSGGRDSGVSSSMAGRPGTGPRRTRATGAKQQPTDDTATPAAPGAEMAPDRNLAEDAAITALGPLRAQIHGSKDHLRVAQALFKAGQSLMDRGKDLREQGRVEVARKLDDRAREKLEIALRELEPLVKEKEPRFVDLFYLGRCRELLFRYSERHEALSFTTSQIDYQRREQSVRDPFLQISARDVKKVGASGGVEVLGSWGQAAKIAMEHFRWMNTNAGYDAMAKIDSLTWPGEDKQ